MFVHGQAASVASRPLPWQDESGCQGRRTFMETRAHPSGLQDVLEFPLVEALFGRRARRFSLGASIRDGSLAFTSRHDPLPLSELEQMLVLTAAAGNTGWHYMITRHAGYAPHLPNYSGRREGSLRGPCGFPRRRLSLKSYLWPGCRRRLPRPLLLRVGPAWARRR